MWICFTLQNIFPFQCQRLLSTGMKFQVYTVSSIIISFLINLICKSELFCNNSSFSHFMHSVAHSLHCCARPCTQVYKSQHSMAPNAWPSSVDLLSTSMVTSNCNPPASGHGQLDVLRVRLLPCGGCTFCYAGPSAWNALPDHLKSVLFLWLLLDASLNIYTSHIASTPSTFKVSLQLTCCINYSLT